MAHYRKKPVVVEAPAPNPAEWYRESQRLEPGRDELQLSRECGDNV